MNTDKIRLTENHRRSLSSALIIVEQMLHELEATLLSLAEGCCYEIKKDIGDDTVRENLEIIRDARARLCLIASRYETKKYSQSLKKIVNAKRTRMWEVLMDMKPRKQKGFGEFPPELAGEFSKDIEDLLSLTEKIRS